MLSLRKRREGNESLMIVKRKVNCRGPQEGVGSSSGGKRRERAFGHYRAEGGEKTKNNSSLLRWKKEKFQRKEGAPQLLSMLAARKGKLSQNTTTYEGGRGGKGKRRRRSSIIARKNERNEGEVGAGEGTCSMSALEDGSKKSLILRRKTEREGKEDTLSSPNVALPLREKKKKFFPHEKGRKQRSVLLVTRGGSKKGAGVFWGERSSLIRLP